MQVRSLTLAVPCRAVKGQLGSTLACDLIPSKGVALSAADTGMCMVRDWADGLPACRL